jgi:asparagine synthase (glutamine-hydrolysing)
MSGIFGYLGRQGNPPARSAVGRMALRMRHQPYYVVETASPAEDVVLGRIGIGIFNRASQPVQSVDSRVRLWLCGEFYHQQARRQHLAREAGFSPEADDAELALQVYLRHGAAGLARLEGAFIVAVWDLRTPELVVVNDRYGLYPHYFAHVDGRLAFAPEIKGVLEAPGVPRRLDLTAVAEYLRFQHLLGDRTWLEEVQLLPAASVLRYIPANGRLSLNRYWDWDAIGSRSTITFDDALRECIRLFQRAADAMAEPSDRVGVYLSGGVDGRMILGFLDGRMPVPTLTYGAPGCRDVVYAAELARRAGSEHHWFPFYDGRWVLEYAPLHLALTEGMHNWLHAHGISTLAQARQLIGVNLSGYAGGMVPAFDRSWSEFQTSSEADLLRRIYDQFCQRNQWPGLTESEAETLLTGRGDRRLRGLAFESLRDELSRTSHYPLDRRAEYFTRREFGRRSNQYMLVFTRSAVEVRCPFLDYDFVDFACSLPEYLRTRPDLRRAMITRRMPHLATVPYDRDNRLPHSSPLLFHSHATLQRLRSRINRHLGPLFREYSTLYADYEHYLRTDLREWAEGILFDRRTLERGFFDPDAVRALWERHLSGTELWTIGKIAPLITLELSLRSLVDGEVSPQAPNAVSFESE